MHPPNRLSPAIRVKSFPVYRPEPVEEPPIVDLMEALRRSVEEAQKRKPPASGEKKKAAASKPRRARAKSA